jgi:putative membrane protein
VAAFDHVHPLVQIFAAVAAALHAVIFVMESVVWSKPAVWRSFGVASQADADTVRPMAFNQGFYNLFLAIGIVVGLIIGGASGNAVVVFACLSIVGAAVVLATGGKKYFRPAFIQGVTPLIALVLAAVL